jgi:alpha 1,6-mannosyltransferase
MCHLFLLRSLFSPTSQVVVCLSFAPGEARSLSKETWRIKKHIIYTNKIPSLKESWLRLNPDFSAHFFNDQKLEGFLHEHRPEFAKHLHAMTMVEKADLFRYAALFHYGGVYTDVDVDCVRPIKTWLDDFQLGVRTSDVDFIIGLEFEDVQHKAGTAIQLVQWVFASAPRNPLLDYVLQECLRSIESTPHTDDDSTLHRTGPVMFTKGVLRFISRHASGHRGESTGFFNYPKAMLQPEKLEREGHYFNLSSSQGVILPYRAFGYHPQHRGKYKMDQHHQVEHRFAGSWRTS